MIAKLTKTLVEATAPGPRDVFVWDAEVKGFGLRVKPSGVRSYMLKYGVGRRGLSRWITIGKHGSVTAAQARLEAQRLLGVVAMGGDPAAAARVDRGIPTVREFSERYQLEHSKRESSKEKDEQLLRLHVLPAFGSRRMDQVHVADVRALRGKLAGKPVTANRCLSLVSHLYAQAWRWGALPAAHNPARGVERYREEPRERYLSAAELRRLGASLALEADEGNAYGAGAIRVLLLTGARASEILSLRRDAVNLRLGLARLSRRKRGPLALVLPAGACAILREQPRLRSSPWVFPGALKGQHLTIYGLEQVWQRVRARAKLDDVRLHDLRHTFASVLAGRGASLPIIGGLLGHSQPATTARYAHLADGPLRVAADGAADAISAALGKV